MDSHDFNKRLSTARNLMHLNNHVEALRVYGELVKKKPHGALMGEYARAATIYGDFDLAEQLWKRIRGLQPNSAEMLSRLAWEHQQIRLHAKARELYQLASELEPRDLETQLSLAWVLARTGTAQEARPAIERCLALGPGDEKARFLKAQLDRRDGKLDCAEQQYRDLLASNPRDTYVHYACYSELAGIYDRAGRFDDAMAELMRGKSLPHEPAQDESDRQKVDAWHDGVLKKIRALPKNILDIWSQSFPAKMRKPAVSLAWLTGSARSGTTLLERVLDAHPAVSAADESLAFTRIMPLVDIAAPSIPAPTLSALRKRYLAMLLKTSGPGGPDKLMLDKNPSRTIWLGAMLRVFPEVKIIMALRDPRDVVISLYFQNQTGTNYQTFEMLARYYAKVMDLWLAAREWTGFAWLETRYEDVVNDLPGEGARVTKFLGLEWKDEQARFFENNRHKPVMSTNYNEVSQPVYKRAAGRWRAYEKYLAPALPILEPYCKTFGYT